MRAVWEQIFLDSRQTALFLPNKKFICLCVHFRRALFLKQPDLLSALERHQGQMENSISCRHILCGFSENL